MTIEARSMVYPHLNRRHEDPYKQGNPWYPVCSCKYTPSESQTSHYFLAIFMCMFVSKGESGWSTAQSVLREMQEKMDKVLITMMFLSCHYFRVIKKLDVSTWKLGVFFWTDFQVWCVQINSCKGVQGLWVDWTCAVGQITPPVSTADTEEILWELLLQYSQPQPQVKNDWILTHSLVWLRSSINLASDFSMFILMLLFLSSVRILQIGLQICICWCLSFQSWTQTQVSWRKQNL